MKTLIINGSPRRNGDTAALVARLAGGLRGGVDALSAYRAKISPCVDCRRCWRQPGCAIDDDMRKVYRDDYDNLVIASPVHVGGLPGPMVSLAGRLQAYYAAARFLGSPLPLRPKKAGLVIVGGGDGDPAGAVRLADWIAATLNAGEASAHAACSLRTDELPAAEDSRALAEVDALAAWLSIS